MSAEPGGNGLVQVAYLHQARVSYSWFWSMRNLDMYDLFGPDGEGGPQCMVPTGGPIAKRAFSGTLVEDRNFLAAQFLDSTPHEWCFLIDTDMGFAPDTVERLLEVADPAKRPVVGALCFVLQEAGPDGMGGMRVRPAPTLYQLARLSDGDTVMVTRAEFPPDTVLQVAGTGAACLLVHRSALEKVRAEHGDRWFDQMRNKNGKLIGEDLAFCARLGAAGIPVHVHTGVQTTHHKDVWIGVQDYRPPVAEPRAVPPATGEVAVIVPVMQRPQNAAPFMASLRASTGLATVYAVWDQSDEETADAWESAGAQLISDMTCGDRPGTFAEKVNSGYLLTQHEGISDPEPWLFICGDDVRFHPGWLDHAQHVAATTGAKVVGTNDLGTERVQAGEHATHLLIARDYITGQGASWDGPGVVCHEGYRHWFVDDEIVAVAKQRGVWAPATASVVEHLHPLFGKAESDPVYRLGQSFAEQDRALYERRVADHA